MKIQRIVNAAIGATRDRARITQDSRHVRKLSDLELACYKKKREISGPSVHNPVKIAKNWKRAFLSNLEREDMIERLNAPFKGESTITTIKKVIKDIVKTIKNA